MMAHSAVYNEVVYNEQYYGALVGEPSDNTLRWAIEIDWDGDGVFSGTNEAEYCHDLKIRRGRNNLINSDGTGFEQASPGELSLTLSDSTNRYDPYNANSPLYPNVRAGRYVRVWVRLGLTGVKYYLFTGRITDIKPQGYLGETITITAKDAILWLQNRKELIPVAESKTVSNILNDILDAVSWPASWGRNIEINNDYVLYWWNNADKNVWDGIVDLVNSFGGNVYVAGDGKFVYRDRLSSRGTVATLNNSMLLKEIYRSMPWDNMVNVVKVDVNIFARQEHGTIYELTQPMLLEPGNTVISVPYLSETPYVLSGDTPVPNTNYKMYANSNGTGTDYTSSCSVGVTYFPDAALLSISNNSGTSVYMTKLELTGYAIKQVTKYAKSKSNDASIAKNDKSVYHISSDWVQYAGLADTLINELYDYFAGNPDTLDVTVEQGGDINYKLELYDYVDVNISYHYVTISGVYQVGGIEIVWGNENGQAVLTRYRLEKPFRLTGNYWTFTTQVGVSSYFAP